MLVENACRAAKILGYWMGGRKNGIFRLYAELLTARLNIAQGATPSAIDQTLAEVDAFLATKNSRDWCGLDKATRCLVSHWQNTLFDWNHGTTGPGACAD